MRIPAPGYAISCRGRSKRLILGGSREGGVGQIRYTKEVAGEAKRIQKMVKTKLSKVWEILGIFAQVFEGSLPPGATWAQGTVPLAQVARFATISPWAAQLPICQLP